MAKRFTDSDKWKDAWFSELEQEDKLLWLYLLDECNHAGIWKVNIRFLNFAIGSSYTLDSLVKVLGSRVYLISSEYLLIEKWVHFQHPNGLNEKSKPQKACIDMLLKFNVLDRVNKGYDNPVLTSQDKDKDKDKDKAKDKGKDKATGNEADAERVYQAYPRKVGKQDGLKAIIKALKTTPVDQLLEHLKLYGESVKDKDKQFLPHPATYFNKGRHLEPVEIITKAEPNWKLVP